LQKVQPNPANYIGASRTGKNCSLEKAFVDCHRDELARWECIRDMGRAARSHTNHPRHAAFRFFQRSFEHEGRSSAVCSCIHDPRRRILNRRVERLRRPGTGSSSLFRRTALCCHGIDARDEVDEFGGLTGKAFVMASFPNFLPFRSRHESRMVEQLAETLGLLRVRGTRWVSLPPSPLRATADKSLHPSTTTYSPPALDSS